MALSRPVVGVLAVQGAVYEHAMALGAVGADVREVRAPRELDHLDGLIIPGGESTTFGLVAERSGLLAALRDMVAEQRMPVLGTCAGMIMLARETTAGAQPLIGGIDIVVRRNAFGRQVASFEAAVEMPVLGPELVPGVFIRAPWIEWAAPHVEVLATHAEHGVAARQGDLVATAFHPELTEDRRLHAWFVDLVRARREGSDRRSEGGVGVRAQ